MTTVSTRRMEITLCFAFQPRFRLAPHCFSKTIDAFSGCLYPQRRNIFPPAPVGNFHATKYATQSKSPLAFSIVGLIGHLKTPDRDEKDKCAV